MDTANVSILLQSCKQNAKKIFITSRFLLQNINQGGLRKTSPGQAPGGRHWSRPKGSAASHRTAAVIPQEFLLHERKKENHRTCKTDFFDKVWRFQEKALYLCTDFGTQCKI